jgi:hypothetical protein
MNQPTATVIHFPPITKQKALEIAAQVCKDPQWDFDCYSKRPERCALYGTIPDEPCWYVYAPWGDNRLALRSSRVIVISRLTGKIILDGSAGDEG